MHTSHARCRRPSFKCKFPYLPFPFPIELPAAHSYTSRCPLLPIPLPRRLPFRPQPPPCLQVERGLLLAHATTQEVDAGHRGRDAAVWVVGGWVGGEGGGCVGRPGGRWAGARRLASAPGPFDALQPPGSGGLPGQPVWRWRAARRAAQHAAQCATGLRAWCAPCSKP